MTFTISDNTARTLGTNRARASTMPIGYPGRHPENALGAPSKQYPGTAIAFAIAAVVAMLVFIEMAFA